MELTHIEEVIDNIIKEDETAFYIDGEGLKQLKAEDLQEFKQYINMNIWKADKSKNRIVLYKADDDVINWLNEHKHFHLEEDVYYLVSDVNRAENKDDIIKFFESNWYVKRESRWRRYHYNKMIYIKRL